MEDALEMDSLARSVGKSAASGEGGGAMKWLLSLLVCALGLPGCSRESRPGPLDREIVTELPDGNAQGSALSGSYDVETYVARCNGACPVIDYGLFTVSTCDAGDTDTIDVVAEQTDGHLRVQSEDLLVPRMEGGVNVDGSFDIGGYATDDGGSIEYTARFSGILDTEGQITGQGQVHGWGTVEDTLVNCTGTYEIEGSLEAL